MSGAPAARDVVVAKATPQLPTKSLRATKEWYERHLGFQANPEWEAWDFLILYREETSLFFYPADDPKLAEAGTFYLRVRGDIDALWKRLAAEGVDAHDPPEDRPYGMRDFTVHDADGRHVSIGKPLEGP